MTDPDLIAAREIVKATLTLDSHRRCNCREHIDAGEWDAGQKVRATLAGIKHGREGLREPFEAMIYDAHLPSMTARFRIPPGLPFATGMYAMRRVRRPTAEDIARWAHLPEPPEDPE